MQTMSDPDTVRFPRMRKRSTCIWNEKKMPKEVFGRSKELRQRSNTLLSKNSLFERRRTIKEGFSGVIDACKESNRLMEEKMIAMLASEWHTNLFRRFLQQKHWDQVLECYLVIQNFKEIILICKEDNGGLPQIIQLLKLAIHICIRFRNDSSCPIQIRDVMKETQRILVHIGIAKDATFEIPKMILEIDQLAPCEDYSKVFNECFLFKITEKMYHNPKILNEEEMIALDCTDKDLFNGTNEVIFSHLKKGLQKEKPSWPILGNLMFLVPERILYRVMLDEFFPNFICEHDQNYSSDMDSYGELSRKMSFGIDSLYIASSEDVTELEETDDFLINRMTDGSVVVDAATIEKTISFLFDGEQTGILFFQHTAVACFSYYTTIPTFLGHVGDYIHLLERTPLRPPAPLIKATNFLKQIISHHPRLAKKNREYITDFATNIIKPLSNPCCQLIHRQLKKLETKGEIEIQLQFTTKRPKIRASKIELEKLEHSFTITSLSPLEFSRQLAICDFKIFQRIELNEYLHMRWTKKHKETLSPNVLLSIRQFCKIGYWIAHQIVSEMQFDKRVRNLGLAIKIAFYSLQQRNFNGAMAVTSGLQNNSVYRLTDTWDVLPEKTCLQWMTVQTTLRCDMNYSCLRSLTKEAFPPAVPYLGMFLSDLTFISNEENFLEHYPKMINFVKLVSIGSITLQIKHFQSSPYCLSEIPSVQAHFQNIRSYSEDELWELSNKTKQS